LPPFPLPGKYGGRRENAAGFKLFILKFHIYDLFFYSIFAESAIWVLYKKITIQIESCFLVAPALFQKGSRKDYRNCGGLSSLSTFVFAFIL